MYTSHHRLRESTFNNLKEQYNILDCFDFIQYDHDPMNFYRWCSRWENHRFDSRDRILILNIDCDFYTGSGSVGNNNWNFFISCAAFGIPTEFFVYFSTSFGMHNEVNYICRQLNLLPPAVVESICVPLLTTETNFNNVDYNESLISNHFVCLNGVERSHRILFLCYLKHYNLFPLGLVSYNFDFGNTKINETKNLHEDVVNNNVIFRTTQPFIRVNDLFERAQIDFDLYTKYAHEFVGQSHLIDIGVSTRSIEEFQPPILQKGLICVVTESVFEYPYGYVSEKTIKAILSKRPFILLSSPGSLSALHSLGFKTFDTVWSEEYDTISVSSNRMQAVAQLLKLLCDKDITELSKQVKEIVEFNYQHYLDNFINNDQLRWYNV